MRQKKCAECGSKFTQWNTLVRCCGVDCAIAYGKKEAPKQTMKANRQAKKEYKASDRQELTKKAQTAFNTYIRTRDGKKCISCGYEGEGRQFHCGHYMSQGGNSALRFNELNCSSQCSICNNHLSGNLANYRKNLILKIGEDAVIELETTKNTKRYSIEELKEIIDTYKSKLKAIR